MVLMALFPFADSIHPYHIWLGYHSIAKTSVLPENSEYMFYYVWQAHVVL